MAGARHGPGVSKVRWTQAISRRVVELVAIRGGWWSSMLERADVISEGGSSRERGATTYYGSTSLLCPVDELEAFADRSELAELVLADPHARLRLLRIAHREAAARADGPLGVLHAEMSGRLVESEGERFVAIEVDVSATVVEVDRDAM